MQQDQRTEWILAERIEDGKRDARCRWRVVEDERTEQSAGVLRVEVLRDVEWGSLHATVPTDRDVEVRCGLVLRACPHLQHFDLTVDGSVCQEPTHADTFALIPRLRSLRLQQCSSGRIELRPLSDCRAMLDGLPHLRTLRCFKTTSLSIKHILDFASHSTLEEVHINIGGPYMTDNWWIGRLVLFPIDVEEDELQLQGLAIAHRELMGDVEEEDTEALQAALVDHMSAASQQSTGNEQEQQQT